MRLDVTELVQCVRSVWENRRRERYCGNFSCWSLSWEGSRRGDRDESKSERVGYLRELIDYLLGLARA